MSVSNYLTSIEREKREIENYKRKVTSIQKKILELREENSKEKIKVNNRIKHLKTSEEKQKLKAIRDREIEKNILNINRFKSEILHLKDRISKCRNDIGKYRESIRKIKSKK